MCSDSSILHQGSCSVAEKHGGALLRVIGYRIMQYLVMLREVEYILIQNNTKI